MPRPYWIPIAIVVLTGCKEDTIDSLVEDLIGETNSQVDIVCTDCADELGQTRSECQDNFGFIGPSRERCIKDAYSRDESASESRLSCLRPLEAEYTTCLENRLDCNDFSSVTPCDDDFDVGEAECIELPQTVQNALDDCFN